MVANGPAVALVNVAEPTGEPSAGFGFSSPSSLRPKGAKHGVVFAVMVQFLFGAGVIAVQIKGRPEITPGIETGSKTLAQYRGTKPGDSDK